MVGPDHDHRVPADHVGIVDGLVETDWNPLNGDIAHMSGAHAMEVRAGKLFVAAYGDMWSTGGGLFIFDVTADPEHPQLLGHLPGLGPMGGDRSLDATSDGAFVVIGTESTPAAYTKTGIANPTPSGLLLIDARDPTLPLIVDYEPSAGFHSVTVHRVAGEDHIFGVDLLGGFPWGDVFRIDRDATPPDLVATGGLELWHDSSVTDDPSAGPLLFAAEGSEKELRIFDVSDPSLRVLVGSWAFPIEQGEEEYYAHSALSWWTEGRRIVLVTSEHEGDEPTPAWFLDATDLSNIQVIGTFLPGQGGSEGLAFSLHNPRYEDGLLYFGHYHAGVVVLDVSTLAKIAAPEIIAYAVPSHDTGYRSPLDLPQWAVGINAIHYPRVYDVALHPDADVVYAADIFMGVYTYRLTGAP